MSIFLDIVLEEATALQERQRQAFTAELLKLAEQSKPVALPKPSSLDGTLDGVQDMGLFSALLTGARAVFGAAAPVATRAVATTGRVAGRALQGRVGQVALGLGGAVAGGAAFEAGIQAFAGDGGGAPALPPGVTPLASLTGGRFLVADANGARLVVGRNGRPIKPQILVPSGMPLPANVSSIVFISADGQTIGVTIKRRRRRLNGELRRVFSTIDVAERITKRLERRTRRRS